MAIKKSILAEWNLILIEIGNPPIDLVPESYFKERTGAGLGYFIGRAAPRLGIITIRQNLDPGTQRNTLWHELGHCLFPNKPHWWIECFATKMARAGHIYVGRYTQRYCHGLDDLPSREELLKMCRAKSYAMNKSITKQIETILKGV